MLTAAIAVPPPPKFLGLAGPSGFSKFYPPANSGPPPLKKRPNPHHENPGCPLFPVPFSPVLISPSIVSGPLLEQHFFSLFPFELSSRVIGIWCFFQTYSWRKHFNFVLVPLPTTPVHQCFLMCVMIYLFLWWLANEP